MWNQTLWRATALLALASLVPACHDDDDDDDGGGPISFGPVAATLSGDQENPPVETFGRGSATVTPAADGNSMAFTLEVSSLVNITAAHIHAGKPGVNGPIIFTLSSGSFTSPLSGTLMAADFQPGGGITTFSDAVAAVAQGLTYVNVHTSLHPDGAIRGHLGPATFQTVLSGANEVPPNVYGGTGTATVTLNALQTEITFTLQFSGLSSPTTAAHIHVEEAGENGPIIFTLAMAPVSPLNGTLTAPNLEPRPEEDVETFADAVNAMLSGETYINVHTTTYPNGEIRGQLAPVP